MSTLADSLVSSSSRKLPIRKRPDLKARKQRYQGRLYWVVKDPVGLQYYRFEEEEYAILQMLDGQSSLDEIAQQFEREFPPQTIRTEELQQFIGMLHRSGLVITDAAGQGQQLVKRRDEKKKQELLAPLTNILSMRFKGIDPERFFNFIYPYIRWFFTVPAMVCCITLALAALTLVIVQFDVFHSRLPAFHSFFRAQNWLWLALTLCVTKILHEFGHGLSCKHFGGECHEIGVMFLVLTPCLYCNVSDSWMLPNRWHRAAIGAAGMYVELVLASICTFIWWFSEPGPLNYICLNVMFVSSVSTVMFNANPLLRYDGYYILSDILEIPNLRQKASTILNRKLGKWCLGLEEPEDPFLPQRKQWLFATYTVASAIYRWVVTFSILYFLNKVFEPYGLKVLGQAIAIGSLYGLLIQPLWNVYKFFRVPGRLGKVKSLRVYATLAGDHRRDRRHRFRAAAVARLLPARSAGPRRRVGLRETVDGILEKTFVQPGDQVTKGQLLAQLTNIDVDFEIDELTGQRNVYEAQLKGLNLVSLADRKASSEIEPTTKALASTNEQLQAAERRSRLCCGSSRRAPAPCCRRRWSKNRATSPSTCRPGTARRSNPRTSAPTSSKAPSSARSAIRIRSKPGWSIDQGDIEFVAPGQKVEIMLTQTAEYVYVSTIERVSTENQKTTPTHLSSLHGGDLPSKADASGAARPLSPIYEAVVPLPENDPNHLLRIGLVGKAKISTAPRTLWARLVRYLSHTFNFEL